jgi:hypothetical protein
MAYKVCFLIPAYLVAAAASSTPHPEPTLLDQGYRHMYNREFAEAHQSFQQWEHQKPDDPLGPVSDAAAYLFSEFDRLHILQSEFFTHDQHFITDNRLSPDPELKRNFLAALEASRTLAARAQSSDNNAMFATILTNGLESDYSALIEKRYSLSFQKMKAGRALAEKLLAADPTCYDAWIAVGVENYMLSVKPAPVRWLLRIGGGQTDRSLGIEKLKLTAEKGRYLAPFAQMMLAVAAIRDNNTRQAKDLLVVLAAQYPRNPLYRQEIARLEPLAFRSTPE